MTGLISYNDSMEQTGAKKETIHSDLELEMRQLNAEIEKRASEGKIEKKQAALEAVGEMLQKEAGQGAPAKAPASKVLPAYSAELSPDDKLRVETLVDEVFHKGPLTAVKAAKKEKAAVLDAFKDSLVKALEERSLL